MEYERICGCAWGQILDSIGLNQYDLKDEDGKFYVREIIDKANRGGGWVDFKMKNAFQSIYVERVDLGSDNFVIGSGLFPISKRETALIISAQCCRLFKAHVRKQKHFLHLVILMANLSEATYMSL